MGIENNRSQMVKIEESENFQPRRKMTSSLKIVAFLEKNYFAQNTLYNSFKHKSLAISPKANII